MYLVQHTNKMMIMPHDECESELDDSKGKRNFH